MLVRRGLIPFTCLALGLVSFAAAALPTTAPDGLVLGGASLAKVRGGNGPQKGSTTVSYSCSDAQAAADGKAAGPGAPPYYGASFCNSLQVVPPANAVCISCSDGGSTQAADPINGKPLNAVPPAYQCQGPKETAGCIQKTGQNAGFCNTAGNVTGTCNQALTQYLFEGFPLPPPGN